MIYAVLFYILVSKFVNKGHTKVMKKQEFCLTKKEKYGNLNINKRENDRKRRDGYVK